MEPLVKSGTTRPGQRGAAPDLGAAMEPAREERDDRANISVAGSSMSCRNGARS